MARKKSVKSQFEAVQVQQELEVVNPLSKEELQELKRCESQIKRGWDTFIEVGRALAKIQKDHLYRGDYRTFESYCKERWQYAKSHAYRLIGAAEVIEHLSPIGDKTALPLNESQVRPLIGLPKELQLQAWKNALEKGGDKAITAKLVRESVVSIQSPNAVEQPSTPKRPKKMETALRGVEAAIAALENQDAATARQTLEELLTLLSGKTERSKRP